jgi:small GTP-binding protein
MTKEYTIKVVVIGDMFTGKTSLVHNCNNNYNLNNYESTIGVDFSKKTIEFNNNIYKLFIWDTSGQEKFNSIVYSYFRNISVALVVYDITNRNSFLNIEKWLIDLHNYSKNDNLLKIVIGNKIDLDKKREVLYEEGAHFCKKYGIIFHETSIRTNENLNNVFDSIINYFDKKITNNEITPNNNNGIKLNHISNMEFEDSISSKKPKCCIIL